MSKGKPLHGLSRTRVMTDDDYLDLIAMHSLERDNAECYPPIPEQFRLHVYPNHRTNYP
jgi:hypothetical protein